MPAPRKYPSELVDYAVLQMRGKLVPANELRIPKLPTIKAMIKAKFGMDVPTPTIQSWKRLRKFNGDYSFNKTPSELLKEANIVEDEIIKLKELIRFKKIEAKTLRFARYKKKRMDNGMV